MVALQSDRFSVGTGELRIDNTDERKEYKDSALTESTCGTLDDVHNLSSFDACWFGMQLDGVENLKSGIARKNRTMIKLGGGRGSLVRTRSIRSSPKPMSFLESCRQAHFVDARFQQDKQPSSSVLFTEKGQCETCFHQPNESMSCSEVKFWKGKVVDGKIKLVKDTLIDEKRSCQSRQELPMLHKKRKAFSRSTSMVGNLIKCQHSAQEVSSSVLKALLFSLGVGVGIKYMLDFGKTEVESLLQKLREAEDMVHDLRQQRESKSKICTDGIVSCSSMMEDPDSNQLLNDSASRSTDAKFAYNHAAEDLHFTSGREGGGPFQSIVRVDSVNSTGQIADLEAELEAELEILQLNLANECSSDKGLSGVSDVSYLMLELDPLVDVVHGELSSCGLPGMHDVREDKDHSPHIAVQCANWAVCPRELDRRLQLLLQTRQEKHISELEAELKAAELKLKDKEQLLEAWKGRVGRLTKLLPSDTSGDDCTRINDQSNNIISGDDCTRISDDCTRINDQSNNIISGDDCTRINDQSKNSIAAQAERNCFSEDRHDKTRKNLKSSIHDHEAIHFPLKHIDQTTAGKFNKHISSSMGSTAEGGATPARSSMENVTNEDSNDYTWEDFMVAVDGSSQHEGHVILQARCESQKNVLSEQVAGQDMDVDAFESSVTKIPIENSFGVKASKLPETLCHLKTASCTSDTVVESNPSRAVYEQSVKTRKPILSFMNIGRFDKCKIEDNQGSIWNSSYLSAPTNTPVGAAQARKDRLFNTPNSRVTQRPMGFSTEIRAVNVNEKIKFWEEVSKGGSIQARDLETEASIFPEVGTESWSTQGEQLLSLSFSCSENDSLSDESSMLDSDEHMGEALIKRIVEKTKSGSNIVRDVQTMLAVLETQETFPVREENALLDLDMKSNCSHEHDRNRCTCEAGKRKTPPSAVPSEMISLHATPKTKGVNACKRSLFEEPVYMASKGFSNT